MLRIADLGRTFGIAGGSVFQEPWKSVAEVVVPKNLQDFVDQSDKIDLVIFGGGSDIHPDLYNHKNVASHVSATPSFRDVVEVASFKVCIQKKIPVLGICRGAQLACAMAGGFLVQHVVNHAGMNHNILDVITGKKHSITSAHHQMMVPGKVKHTLIAKMEEPISKIYMFDNATSKVSHIDMEPEIVYFPTVNCLAVQGHPEFMACDHETVVYVRQLVNKYLLEGRGLNV